MVQLNAHVIYRQPCASLSMYITPTEIRLSNGSPVLHRIRLFYRHEPYLLLRLLTIHHHRSPSNTGDATWMPKFLAAIPKCNSNTCPMFIRDGTPSGFNMISLDVHLVSKAYLLQANLRDNPFVTMTTTHFVPNMDFTFYDVYTY